MDDRYLSEFKSFRDEFQLAQDEIRRSISETPSLLAKAVSLESENTPVARLGELSPLVNRCSNLLPPHKVSDLMRARTAPSFTSKAAPRQIVKHTEPGAKRVSQNHRIVDESLLGSTGLGSRRGYRKSRRGCFNCKQRKIKCQETQPACANCMKVKINCVYPTPKTLQELQQSQAYATTPISSANLQATPILFSAIDMRLFYHFLQQSYPHLPVGSDTTWTDQVPLIAHHNQYLMHAILGNAASHLQLLTEAPLTEVALRHRILAIRGCNEALSKTDRNGSDGDALLAASYLLAYQSSYMADGMQECFRILRGCLMLDIQLKAEKLPMAFFLSRQSHFDTMRERLLDLPVLDEAVVNDAKTSLQAVRPRLVDAGQRHAYQLLMEIIVSLTSSSLKSYFKFLLFYQCLFKLDTASFNHFLDTHNYIARILLGHFLAIELVMEPIHNRELGGRSHVMPTRYHLNWIPAAYNDLPLNLNHFLDWPNSVALSVRSNYPVGH